MRVIAGQYRSRLLEAPRGLATRPTSDRLRETLFNILAPSLEGAMFLDLFAGSGAVGIEALSRGAAFVLFVDNAPAAVAAIRANLAALGIRSGFRVEARAATALLRRDTQTAAGSPAAKPSVAGPSLARPWNMIFLDPPYRNYDAYGTVIGALGAAGLPLLKPGGVVIAEHTRRESLEESYGELHRSRLLRQGDSALSFYRKSTDTVMW